MTIPSGAELALLRTQPHLTRLHLSVYKPKVIMTAQVNDGSAAKGMKVISFDNAAGSYDLIKPGMTLLVGTTPGGREKGSIYVFQTGAGQITVGENSHIYWQDDDYITIIDFYQIWPLYPRYVQSGENITVYKLYSVAYSDQNENLGQWICMGPHHAGYLVTGAHSVYYTSDGTTNMQGNSMTYDWAFEGGTPTGSSVAVPGWVTYNAPGHYSTKLTVTDSAGASEASVRHISIYDRPGVGTGTNIVGWGLESLTGSRDQGGYTARLWVEEQIDDIQDGSLIVIFSEDWYGATEQSIGGNATNRKNTVFVGYVIGSTIDYDYQSSRVTFEAASATEVMKQCEAFSVTLEDTDDPAASAASKGGSPWFYLTGLNCMTALYHYLRWHSNVNYCTDIRFLADALPIHYFDADRSSLYDAVNSLMQSALIGAVVCDRQGRIYMERDVSAVSNASVALNKSMFVDNNDWVGQPSITERMVNASSYIEAGGVSYDVVSKTDTPYLACAPGVTPAYRGSLTKLTGLALTDQTTLNALVGNLYAYKNSKYPRVELEMAGNYRNLDIAPQELITLSMAPGDTFRNLTWTQKAFAIRSVEWEYDALNGLFHPRVEVAEVTSGWPGDTIEIPAVPPTSGYEVPPFEMPPFPVLPPYEFPTFGGNTANFVQPTIFHNMDLDTYFGDEMFDEGEFLMKYNQNYYAHGWCSAGGGGTLTATAVFATTAAGGIAGNALLDGYIRAGGCNQSPSNTSTNYSAAVPIASSPTIYCTFSYSCAVSAGDVVHLIQGRIGTGELDTFVGHLRFLGWGISIV